MSDETETTTIDPEATTTEPAAVQAEPPPGFTQKQVDEIVSREKRKWRSQAGKKVKETTPAITTEPAGDSELLSEVRALRADQAELRFRNWAEEKHLNPKQREVTQSFADLAAPDSWDGVLEARGDIISMLGAAVANPEAPAPKQPMTAEAPGTATNQTRKNPLTMTAADIRGTSREERDTAWTEHQAAHGGTVRTSLFTPRVNGRGKGNG